MYYRTQNLQYSAGVIESFLGALTSVPSHPVLGTTPFLLLFTGTAVPGPSSVVADFPPPAYGGYAPLALPTLSIVNLTPFIGASICNALFEQIIAPGDVVTGYILSDLATGGHYLGGERFPNPIGFVNPGDFLSLDLVLPLAYLQPAF